MALRTAEDSQHLLSVLHAARRSNAANHDLVAAGLAALDRGESWRAVAHASGRSVSWWQQRHGDRQLARAGNKRPARRRRRPPKPGWL